MLYQINHTMKSLRSHVSENLVTEGITYNAESNSFSFNYAKDSASDIIKFSETSLHKISIGKNIDDVYYFGYKFETDVQSKIRTEFFNQFRFGNKFTSKENKSKFIDDALIKLNSEINLSTFSTVVYPASRSIINQDIIKQISKFYRVKLTTFELVKKLPSDITFDFDRYSNEVLDAKTEFHGKIVDRYTERQKSDAIEKINSQLNSIHTSDYFSIANSVKSNKLKPYFNEFLTFKNSEEENLYKAIQDKHILVIDDVTTTGSTIIEIVKTLRTLNPNNKIVVFTIIGKDELL